MENEHLSTQNFERLWRRYGGGISATVTGLLVLVCYGFALGLPLFFDDLPIMTWLSHHDWLGVWSSSESAYYRPLTFVVYKLGQILQPGIRQVMLHAVNLVVLWLNSLLLMAVTKLCGRSSIQALLAGVLLVVFPFAYMAIPWVTALGHPLVTFLTLFAVYAALRAEHRESVAWWGVSLAAVAAAPFAHESGAICSVIVAGVVLVQRRLRKGHVRVWGFLLPVVLGLALNVGAIVLRGAVPGISGVRFVSPNLWLQNVTYFLHGLIYPVAAVVEWLVQACGWQDLALVQLSTVLLLALVVWLGGRTADWRWLVQSLWWWACASLPAILSLDFGYLYISPRLHILPSVGVVMLWSWVLVELAKLVRSSWRQWLLGGVLAGTVIGQNLIFLGHQRTLFQSLNTVYHQVLEAAEPPQNAPLGFVNLPVALASKHKTYALILENVVFIPWYSNVGEFIEVNLGWRDVDGVVFTPVRTDTNEVFAAQGPGLDWDGMRRFATEHRTVWLARYKQGEFRLDEVGSISPFCGTSRTEPHVRFDAGPEIDTISVGRVRESTWAVELDWRSSGPTDGDVFVHVRDANGNLIVQADGPALGGMVPIWIWQTGDCIIDKRVVELPARSGPYYVLVGVYDRTGRFPAFVDGVRAPDDAASVAVIEP